MSKENLEQFMKQVADSEDLQAKIGKEITGDTLVALGAAHGCKFSIEDVQACAELSDSQMEGLAGGINGFTEWNVRVNRTTINVGRGRVSMTLVLPAVQS